MACDLIAGLKIIEVFLCVICLIYKLWTMWETLRVFYELEKQSREWPLSRRIAVDRTGSIFSDIVLGSYVIITIGLLIGHVKGELTKARSTEGFYLVLGTILFLIVGGVSITSVDDVPHKLVDNGIILGILTIVTAITFLLDIALVRKQPGQTETKPQKPKQFTYQKEAPKKIESKPNAEKIDEVDKNKKRGSGLFQELKSSLKRRTDGGTNHQNTRTPERTVEFQERELHESERQKRATDEISPQVGRRNMENRGFNKQYSHEDDATSRRSLDPEEFERSFHKIQKQPNGYIKNDDRQAAFNTRDDERSYLRTGDPNYRRHDDRENPFTRAEEYHSERYRENYRPQNGYVRRDGGEHPREEYHRPNGHIRHGDESDFQQKQRRHSIDYMDRDDSSRRSKEYHRERVTRAESPPRSYRTEGGDEYSRVIKNQDRNEFEDLRKPQYVEDRRSYKGYADTVKYLENTSAEKQQRVIDDVDSAMPPKHVIEVEMDDHFYRPGEPQTKKSERRGDERDTLQVAKVSSSQKAEHTGSSDDSELIPQIPSVSFLLSERGRKIMPSLSTSPVERASTPKYYFADPSSPGFVKQTASNWPTSSPVKPQDPKTP